MLTYNFIKTRLQNAWSRGSLGYRRLSVKFLPEVTADWMRENQSPSIFSWQSFISFPLHYIFIGDESIVCSTRLVVKSLTARHRSLIEGLRLTSEFSWHLYRKGKHIVYQILETKIHLKEMMSQRSCTCVVAHREL